MSGLVPTPETRDKQQSAADPKQSVFVSANAGSGKTHVLVERVIRLLLSGVQPDRILCLTFTRAAAAQMQAKVADRLARWAVMEDVELARSIAELGAEPEPESLPLLRTSSLGAARCLFAQALETPGGLKIQTIHAFCERLVQQFPFEANVPAGFEVLDEREAAAMREAAKRQVFVEIGAGGALADAMAAISAENFEGRLDGAFDCVLGMRETFRKLAGASERSWVVEQTRALARALGIAPGTTPDSVRAEILSGGLLADWQDFSGWLQGGGKSDKDFANTLREAARSTDESERLSLYFSVFLTKEFEPKDRLCTSKLREQRPDLAAALEREQERVAALYEKWRAAAALRRTGALYALAEPLLSAYAEAKARRGALDFDDLIAKTLALLSRSDAAWVLFKLDGGIEHLLIDEAQDTNPDAWRIVEKLVEEFTAGQGQRDRVRRTVFAVGDEKQSIYGFQGAVPDEFGRVRRLLERKHREADLEFGDIRLTESFRSARKVLQGVDHVFSRVQAYTGLESIEPRPTFHTSARQNAPGVVELWPLVEAEPEEPKDTEWDAPFDRQSRASPVAKLADRIAGAVQGWIAEGTPPGEILILVRQRLALFEAVLRSLKARRLPVAGADRLVINDHIAVLDLLALGDALVTPDDDLSLASALKSPLFGLDDKDLIQLAPLRRGRLRDALIKRASTDRQRQAVERLLRWEREAQTASPYEFYACVLGRDGMRRAFRSRFGVEADDALDAFLSAAETFSAGHPPTLAGFLLWMRAARTEIKRDLDVGGSEVRVMTVHGAKGLEAGLVVLAETCSPPCGQLPPLLPLRKPAGAADEIPALPLWMTRKAEDCAAARDARADYVMRSEHEHRRLLYVALTRAKDRLVVTGHKGPKRLPETCWYEHVRAGLTEHAETLAVDWSADPILRLAEGTIAHGITAVTPPADLGEPAWLHRKALPEAPAEQPLSPSTLGGASHRGRGGADSGFARERGLLLHRLLESLPAVSPQDRAIAAMQIAGRTTRLPDEVRQTAVDSALAILGDPRFSSVFGPEARVEVSLRGRVSPAGLLVSGRIDRLLVGPHEVLVVDYKTDATPPTRGDKSPRAYLVQIAAYRALLMRLYPEKDVRCALLWTEAPRLDIIDSAILDLLFAELCAASGAEERIPYRLDTMLDEAPHSP